VDSLEVVLEALASALLEGAVELLAVGDAVEAEGAEVFAELAPGDKGPGAAPAVESERADGALRWFAVETRVREAEDAAGGAGGVNAVEQTAEGLRHLETRGVHENGVEAGSEIRGKDGFNARESGSGGCGVFRSSPGFDETHAEDQGGEFFRLEHERRQVEFAAQGVADAGLAFDGLAGELEVDDVAVDGALGDLKALGEGASGLQAAGAQQLHDAEEAVGAPHARCPLELRSPNLEHGAVQANVVALRILEAGVVAEAAGDFCAWDEDVGAEFFGALEAGVEFAVGVEVDEGAVGRGLLAGAMDDAAGDAALLSGKEAAGLVSGSGAEFDVEDGFVKVGGALEVGGGDLEPGDGVVVELAHFGSPVGLMTTSRRIREGS